MKNIFFSKTKKIINLLKKLEYSENFDILCKKSIEAIITKLTTDDVSI